MQTADHMRQKLLEAEQVLRELDELMLTDRDPSTRNRETWRMIGHLDAIVRMGLHGPPSYADEERGEGDEDDDRPTAADYRETEAHHRAWDMVQRGIK